MNKEIFFIIPLVVTVLAITVFDAAAQTPDAAQGGVVERSAIPAEKPLQPSQLPLIDSSTEPDTEDSGSKVLVRDFVINGNTLLSKEILDKVTSGYKGDTLSFSQLRKLCRHIQKQYNRAGYVLVRVYLPPQEIRDGIVEIRIVEGTLGEIQIRGNKRIDTPFIESRLAPNKAGNYPDLMRQLVLLNEYPSFDVKGTLTKGTKPGTTDLIIDVAEKKRYKTGFMLHNDGSRYVSKYVFGPSIEFYDTVRTGDVLALRGFFGSPGRNMNVGSFFYQTPVNRFDTRMHVSYSHSEFEAKREITDLGVSGETDAISVGVTQPLVRSGSTRIDARTSFDSKNIKNYALSSQSSSDRLRVWNLGLDFANQDRWKGRNAVSQTLSIGLPRIFGGLDPVDPDTSRSGAGGEFAKYVIDVTRVQNMKWGTKLVWHGAGQLASTVLPAAEEFYLGGMNSVRGYPQAEYLGDEGYVMNVEWLVPPPYGLAERSVPFLKRTWRQVMQFALFVDHGGAFRKAIAPGENKDRFLTGAGFGLRFYLFDETSVEMDWGFPVGGNDTSDGSDSTFYIKVNARY